MKLRPYQDECVKAVIADLVEHKSSMAVMPTGTGKTVCFAEIIKAFLPTGRVMVIAHRLELIEQAARKIEQITGIKPEIEMGQRWADQYILEGQCPIVVSSIQSQLAGTHGAARMTRFNPNDFALLVIDENHHSTADSYQKMIEHYRQNPDLKLFGCTATPDRADEEALGQVYESVAFEYGIQQAIEDGWLVPIIQRMVFVHGLDFSAIRTTAGDLNGADLDAVMQEEQVLQEVTRPVFDLAGKRKTLVFASSVKHGERMTEILNRYEPDCARFVCGTTPLEARTEIFEHYDEGRFRFLLNVGIATEGWDQPKVELVVMARPTKSRSLYAQMLGRGTRALAGILDELPDAQARRAAIAGSDKCCVEVLDFVGNSGRHKLVHCSDILGGNYSDSVVDEVEREAVKTGKPVDILDELAKAKIRQEQEKRRREEAMRRAAVVAQAKFTTKDVSPFDVLDLTPVKARGWDAGKRLSEKQQAVLERAGVNWQTMPYGQQKQLLVELFARINNGLATLKQARWLRRNGYPQNMSMKDTRALMNAWAANGWQRPPAAGTGTHG